MRKETWDVDLITFIKSRANTPFEWGKHDCTLFAVDCAKAMTGIDLAESYRGYSTEQGAALIVGKAGSFKQLVNQNIGSPILPASAKRGDWVLIKQNEREALGVCMGAIIVAAGIEGIVWIPMSEAICAWRIE